MIRRIGKYICAVLALVCILNLNIFSLSVFAADTYSVNIEISGHDKLIADSDFRKDGVRLVLWKISDDVPEDARSVVKKLDDLTNEELDLHYDYFGISPHANKRGIIEIDGLTAGTYYAKEYIKGEHSVYITSILFYVPASNGTVVTKHYYDKPPKPEIPPPEAPYGYFKLVKKSDGGERLAGVEFMLYESTENGEYFVPLSSTSRGYVYDKHGKSLTLVTDRNGEIAVDYLPVGNYVLYETKTLRGYGLNRHALYVTVRERETTTLEVINYKGRGGYNFMKIADDANKTPLSGVAFKVTRLVDGYYQPVSVNGVEYVVYSGADGHFSVSDLPYGEYFLWEVAPPNGYIALKEPVRFLIGDNVNGDELMVIRNISESSRRIDIPKTGDITLFIMVVSGIILFVIGRFLVRE